MRFAGIGRPEAIPHRDPGPYHRLARRPGAARARGQHGAAPARGAVVVVRVSLRKKRRHPQPGQGRQATAGRERRRQDAGARRPSGARIARRANEETVKSKRDRAILSTLLFHALRRDELCKLKVKDFRNTRRGVPHLNVSGKGDKTRYLPLHPGTNALIHDYLDVAGHGADDNGALFRPIRNNRTGRLEKALTPEDLQAGPTVFRSSRLRDRRPRAAIDGRHQRARSSGRYRQGARVARPRQISTTRIYDHRKTRPEDSPTFKVAY